MILRDRRKMQKIQFGFWESWRRSQSIKRKRAWVQMGEALKGLLPWQGALHKIGGKGHALALFLYLMHIFK